MKNKKDDHQDQNIKVKDGNLAAGVGEQEQKEQEQSNESTPSPEMNRREAVNDHSTKFEKRIDEEDIGKPSGRRDNNIKDATSNTDVRNADHGRLPGDSGEVHDNLNDANDEIDRQGEEESNNG